MMSGIGKETEEPKDIKPIKLYYNSTLSYAEYVAFISNTDTRVLWGGAVGRGLDCQSRGWQIESQLGQSDQKPLVSL